MEVLEFEQSLYELESKIKALKETASKNDLKIIQDLEKRHQKLLVSLYKNLTPWQKVQIARHPNRPKSINYINRCFKDIVYLEGDRISAVDQSVLVGLATYHNHSVMFIGQEKGNDLVSRQKHNFGMTSPAGYRKVIRALELANRWKLPVITFIDTPGAYPGKKAEEFGQAEAIAVSIAACFKLEAPLISVIIGEGGSGGAIAIGVANQVLMLENSVCSIASPEACSSILWKSAEQKEIASKALKLTAQDLKEAGYVDTIISEAIGGAHRHIEETLTNVDNAILQALEKLLAMDNWLLLKAREEKFITFGR